MRGGRRAAVPCVMLAAALMLAAPGRGLATRTPAGRAAQDTTGPRPWMDAARSVEERARLLLARMTLEEKFWQLYMTPGDPLRDSAAFAHGAYGVQLLDLRSGAGRAADAAARANAVQRFFVERTRLGIPVILFEEGVHGLMQRGATVFPQAIGLAATWDTVLVGRVAQAIARQSRERGVRQLLSPVINLARDPRWGRVEETYGEDHWLSAAMGVSYVRALEQAGVVATPKHFVVNHGDGGRDSYPIALDDATLEDLHLPPFRDAIVIGGARSVMAAYNSVNGIPASANPTLLTRTLRDEWRFDGVVIADQGGVGGANVLHHTATGYADATAQALRAGLDVIFQSSAADASLFWPAFRDALVPPAALDTAVVRVLRLKFSLGLFDRPYAGPDTASGPHDERPQALALRAAESSIVLLANPRRALPLPKRLARVAVIGPAAVSSPVGGYSVEPVRGRPLADELAARLGGREAVRVAPGPWPSTPEWTVVPMGALSHDAGTAPARGLRGAYFANPWLAGEPAMVRADASVDFSWTFNRPATGLGTDWYSVRWVGALDVPAWGARLAVEGDDGARLWVDGQLLIDGDRKVSYARRVASRALGAGRHELRLEYRQTAGNGRVRLLWDAAERASASDEQRIAEAVRAASGADAAIVTVTVDEGEFRDRSSLRLPGRQEELIRRVAATGTRTIVVLYAGGAVITEPWGAQVDAVLQAFYPGEVGAEALTRLLFGDASPSARLPYTVPRDEGQLPLVYDHLPTGRGDDYVDGTGQPLYPFGYGLSYAEFEYRDLVVSPARAAAADTVVISFRLRNVGTRASDEVAQLYVRHETAPTAQPVLALRGFARVPLAPGEERQVELRLPASALAVRDVDGRKRLVNGQVVLYVGASSRDLRLRGLLHTLGDQR